jgi:hypothetical protein
MNSCTKLIYCCSSYRRRSVYRYEQQRIRLHRSRSPLPAQGSEILDLSKDNPRRVSYRHIRSFSHLLQVFSKGSPLIYVTVSGRRSQGFCDDNYKGLEGRINYCETPNVILFYETLRACEAWQIKLIIVD